MVEVQLVYSGIETGGPRVARGHHPPPLFCNAVSNENNMKNIEIAKGLIFTKHVAFLTFLQNTVHPLLSCVPGMSNI